MVRFYMNIPGGGKACSLTRPTGEWDYPNRLFQYIFDRPCCPCVSPRLFSGSLVHGLLKSLSAGRSAESLLGGGPLSGKLYCTLLDTLRNCSSSTRDSSGGGGAKRNRRRRGGRGRGRGGGGGGEVEGDLSNRFAFLMTEEEFE